MVVTADVPTVTRIVKGSRKSPYLSFALCLDPALIADLVDRKVDVITVIGTQSARSAKSTTSTVPIAFVIGEVGGLQLDAHGIQERLRRAE